MTSHKTKPIDIKSPEYRTGMQVIAKRVESARSISEQLPSTIVEPTLRTFDGHIGPLVAKAIQHGIIHPEEIPGEYHLGGGERYNLLTLDLLLWHVYWEFSGIPFNLLTDPWSNKFDGPYVNSFKQAHEWFMQLRTLDQLPDFERQKYMGMVRGVPTEQAELFRRVLITRGLDNSTMIDDTIFSLILGSSFGLSLFAPTDDEWVKMKMNLASSMLAFYANVLDWSGHPSLVRETKDFAVKVLYPGVWEYATSELERLRPRIAESEKIMRQVRDKFETILKQEGFVAEVELREGGKSPGSLGLKMKNRFEAQVRGSLRNAFHNPDSYQINARDPRRESLAKGEGLDVRFGWRNPEALAITNPSPDRIVLTTSNLSRGDSSVVVPINPEGPFVFFGVDTNRGGHDISAGRIIVDSVVGCSKESRLERAVSRLSTLLFGAIQDVMRRFGYTCAVSVEEKHSPFTGYRSIHLDTSPLRESASPQFTPFEWILRTRKQHEHAEHGPSAHGKYKDPAGIIRDLESMLGLAMARQKNPEAALVRGKTLHPISIYVGGKKAIDFSVEANLLVIDAIAFGGIDLAAIKSVRAKLAGQKDSKNIGILTKIDSGMELHVDLAGGEKDQPILNYALAKRYLSQGLSDAANKQLMSLISRESSTNGGKKGGHKRNGH